MTNKVKPRRTSGTRPRPEMDSEDPAAHVFVDIETEGQADLLGNPLATPRAIATLHFNNRVNQPTQWEANLRVLGVKEIKTVPYVPLSQDYASHCTSWVQCDTTSLARRRFDSFTPWAFLGRLSPGCSYSWNHVGVIKCSEIESLPEHKNLGGAIPAASDEGLIVAAGAGI